MTFGRALFRIFPATVLSLSLVSCSGSRSGSTVLTADMPLHLEEHLDVATIVGSEVPADLPEVVEWRFDVPQPNWHAVEAMNPNTMPAKVEPTEDALRVVVDESNRGNSGAMVGSVSINVPEWDPSDWDHVLVRARSSGGIEGLWLGYNTAPGVPSESRGVTPYANYAGDANMVNDGAVHSYLLQIGAVGDDEAWHRIGLEIFTMEPGIVEILSVTAVPKETAYAGAPAGTRSDQREPRYGRSAIYTHTPSRIEYRVEIPPSGRLITGLGVLRADPAVSFRVSVEEGDAEPTTVLDETHADATVLAQRRVDLSAFAGRTVTLVLETDSDRRGTIALWGAPTLAVASQTHDRNGGFIEIPSYRFMTSDPGVSDWTVCFSPDGETLLFSRRTRGTGPELFVVPVAGGVPRRLAPSGLPVSATRMNWSLQSGLIAFTGGSDDGRVGVWLIEPDGSNLREISAEGLSSEVFYPSWYPDGRHLAVVDYGGGEGGLIKRIDTQDRTVETLTDREEVLAGMPSVSPDGRSIAFAGQRNAGRYMQSENHIWLLDGEGSLREMDPLQGRTPVWSPDGEWVVFESDRGSPNGHYALFAVPRRGGEALQLTSYEINVNHPSWSPDGTQIAFSAALNLSDPWRIALLDVPEM